MPCCIIPLAQGLSCGQSCLAKIVVFKISHLYRMCCKSCCRSPDLRECSHNVSEIFILQGSLFFNVSQHSVIPLGVWTVQPYYIKQSRKLSLLLLRWGFEFSVIRGKIRQNVLYTSIIILSKVDHFPYNYNTSDNPNYSDLFRKASQSWLLVKQKGDFGAVAYHNKDHVRSA